MELIAASGWITLKAFYIIMYVLKADISQIAPLFVEVMPL